MINTNNSWTSAAIQDLYSHAEHGFRAVMPKTHEKITEAAKNPVNNVAICAGTALTAFAGAFTALRATAHAFARQTSFTMVDFFFEEFATFSTTTPAFSKKTSIALAAVVALGAAFYAHSRTTEIQSQNSGN